MTRPGQTIAWVHDEVNPNKTGGDSDRIHLIFEYPDADLQRFAQP